MEDDPLPLIILAFVISVLMFTTITDSTKKIHSYENNYLIANAPHFVDHYTTLAMVDCMEQKESSCDPSKINLDDWHQALDGTWIQGSFGCMQFSPFTFQEQCVDIYGLEDDIMNCGIARQCATLMVEDGLGYHWSTWKYCQ